MMLFGFILAAVSAYRFAKGANVAFAFFLLGSFLFFQEYL